MQERDQAIATRRPPAASVTASPNAGLSAATRAAASATVGAAAGGAGDFSQAMARASMRSTAPLASSSLAGPGVQIAPTLHTVVAGDTLTSVVKDHAESLGLPLSNAQAHRWVMQVAKDNQISNVNRIFPGQRIAMGDMPADVAALALAARAPQAPQMPTPSSLPAATALQATVTGTSTPTAKDPTTVPTAPTAPIRPVRPQLAAPRHEVLERTLDRAVAKGFIPSNERGDVRDKILSLASEHRFSPDDFARMTLMESDGMNPRATNQRCHGIIQFCAGPDRGAASAGYAANPQAILGLSVYQQLHLVDRYFDDVGLKNKGPAGLDDLYLSVLMPSARSETRADAPLNVSGPQARYLYEGRDSRAPMTRQSILQGLLQNAAERLGPTKPAPASLSNAPNTVVAPSAKGRLQALRTAAYEDTQPPGRTPTQLR